MIKLTKILSELQIANPDITLEKVEKYYRDNIYNNININYDNGWKEYIQLCEPYVKKI